MGFAHFSTAPHFAYCSDVWLDCLLLRVQETVISLRVSHKLSNSFWTGFQLKTLLWIPKTLFSPEKIPCAITLIFLTGDTVSVFGTASNFSSKEAKVKFCLEQRIEYRAHSSIKRHYEKMVKLVGNSLNENAEEKVSCQIKIPENTPPTISNCEILTVQYTIKVCETNISH